jgi:AraC family transcriptional regulator
LVPTGVPVLGENCYLPCMHKTPANSPPGSPRATEAGPAVRNIAEGRDWSIAEYICSAGPGDRGFEERHAAFTVAAVLQGTFRYRTETGASLLYPGAFLLGNFGTCFECGHDHGRGDRCIAFHFGPDYFAEVAASAGGSGKFRFPASMLPTAPASLAWLARMHAVIDAGEPLEVSEAVAGLIELVVAAASGSPPSPQRVSASDERRISATLRSLELGFTEAISLDSLAELANLSKYHFLRTFRRIVGMTPYQYLLGLRLRHAAVRLVASAEPIATIAFDTGFGDLSTFNARFRHQFGASPSRYRAGLRRWCG